MTSCMHHILIESRMLREGCLSCFHRCVDWRERFELSLRVDAYYFFANGGKKKLRFQKYPDTRGRGLKYRVYKTKFKIYLSKQNDLSKAEVDILLLGSLKTTFLISGQ